MVGKTTLWNKKRPVLMLDKKKRGNGGKNEGRASGKRGKMIGPKKSVRKLELG